MSNGMVIEWEGRLYEVSELDWADPGELFLSSSGTVLHADRWIATTLPILRPIEGPTRVELAEALAAADNCAGGVPCHKCAWKAWVDTSGEGLNCRYRREDIIDACRSAGLLPHPPDHAKATE